MDNNNNNREATELQNEETRFDTVPPQYPVRPAEEDLQPTVAESLSSTAHTTVQQATVGSSTATTTMRSRTGSAKAALGKRVAVGAGAGLVIGGVAAALMSMRSADEPEPEVVDEEGNPVEVDEEGSPVEVEEEPATPEELQDAGVYDGQVPVAGGVSDAMSFGEAFAAARQEVGPGGVFQWHGQLYGTYTADEWNSLSPEQQQDYYNHFNWDRIDPPTDNGTDYYQHTGNGDYISQGGGDTNGGNHTNHGGGSNDITVQTNDEPQPFTMNADSEVEVLGVVHDEVSNVNTATITVDGQEAILVDVDGDLQFDYLQADFDGDGFISEGEAQYLNGQGPTVDQYGGFTDGYDPTQDGISGHIDDDIHIQTNDDDFSDDPIDNDDQIYDDI